MELLEKVDCSDGEIINAHQYRKMVFRRRLMAVVNSATIIGVVLYAVAVLSPGWAIIDFVNHRREHVNVRLGVWGEWRRTNVTDQAEWIAHFPEPASHRYLRLAGVYVKQYYWVQAGFSVIALSLMVASNLTAIYTFTHHRYMYKRLTAALFLIVAMCILVAVEVLTSSVDEWNVEVVAKSQRLQPLDPDDDGWDYSAAQTFGFPIYLAWSVTGIYFCAALVFAAGSHKQKGSAAALAEFEIEDRPVHIGRH